MFLSLYYISVAAIMKFIVRMLVMYLSVKGEVDVLLVVDNSCSMEPYQENFPQF